LNLAQVDRRSNPGSTAPDLLDRSWFKRLKLEYEEALTIFAFNILRRYSSGMNQMHMKGEDPLDEAGVDPGLPATGLGPDAEERGGAFAFTTNSFTQHGRGFHWSNFQLNLSCFAH
jgi:hypothetical protein